MKTYNIKGGTAKNDNLFHSFEKFNLHSGETAIFHDSGFQNTISRVTGQDYSWINGKIQSGAANLYLLNPNGVMFGPEVSLALPGSFHVSTADYLKFGDKVDYFYVNQRKDSVLSVESPSAFGFLDDSIGSIRVEGQGSMPGPIIGPPIIDPPIIGPPIIVPPITGSPNIDDNIGDPIPGPGPAPIPGPIPGPGPGPGPIQGATISGLNVSHGKTISLIGGDIELKKCGLSLISFIDNSGKLISIEYKGIHAPGGRINIAAIASTGEVVPKESELKVSSVDFADIIISEKSLLDVSGDGNQGIYIQGNKFTMNNSDIHASTNGNQNGSAVDIRVNTMELLNGSEIIAESLGKGNVGDIKFKVSESITLSGYYDDLNKISLQAHNEGNSGNLIIESKSILSVNSVFSTITDGQGNSGNIRINLSQSLDISLDYEKCQGEVPWILFGVDILESYSEGPGKAGDIIVQAEQIDINKLSKISSKAIGPGKSGDISLDATGSINFAQARITSLNGGNISIKAKNILFNKGAAIQSGIDGLFDSYNKSKGGDISLLASETVSFQEGVMRITKELGKQFMLSGIGLFTKESEIDSGTILIEARNIEFDQASHILSKTEGAGNGGDIILKAVDSVNVFGFNAIEHGNDWGSGIGLHATCTGNASNLIIEANNISFKDGGFISSKTEGKGQGGNIRLVAEGSVTFSGNNAYARESTQPKIEMIKGYGSSGIGLISTYSGEKGYGNSGNLYIESMNIFFDQSANISSTTYGSGTGGNITLKAIDMIDFSGTSSVNHGSSGITLISHCKETTAGKGGDLIVESREIQFQDGSFIASNTYGKGQGGDISLKSSETTIISGESGQRWEDSQQLIRSVENNTKFLDLDRWDWMNRYTDSISSSISITPEDVVTDEQNLLLPATIFVETHFQDNGAGNAGLVFIDSRNVYFHDGGGISSNTMGKGNAGNIRINALESITLAGEGSDPGLSSKLYAVVNYRSNGGNGGNVYIQTKDLLLEEGTKIVTNAFGPGNGGDIDILASGKITIKGTDNRGWAGAIALNSNPNPKAIGSAAGKAGNLLINTGELILEEGGHIATSSIAPYGTKSDKGGIITINARGTIRLSGVNPYGTNEDGFGSGIYARSIGIENSAGNAGTIFLAAEHLIIENGAVIESSTNCNANGGDIDLKIRDTVTISGNASNTQLMELRESQLEYLEGFFPDEYNQSISGIYSSSKSNNIQAGQSGNIKISANRLSLFNGGTISTLSSGGNAGGNIFIDVDKLDLDTRAILSSESLFLHLHEFSNMSELDKHIMNPGDLFHIADRGDGRSISLIYTGSRLKHFNDIYTVSTISELNLLSERLELVEGDIAEVADAGNGQSAQFIYVEFDHLDIQRWVKFQGTTQPVTVNQEDPKKFSKLYEEIPEFYPILLHNWNSVDSSIMIANTDPDSGKSINSVLCIYNPNYPDPPSKFEGKLISLKSFDIFDSDELYSLSENNSLPDGALAFFRNSNNDIIEKYYYDINNWIQLTNAYDVQVMSDINQYLKLQPGLLMHLDNKGNGKESLLFSGNEWIEINQTHQVDNLSERDNLSCKTGDLVYVDNAIDGRSETYLNSDSNWLKVAKGGDAGIIEIFANTIDIKNQSSLITSTSGNGDAGEIRIIGSDIHFDTGGTIFSESNAGLLGGKAGKINLLAKNNFFLFDNSSFTTDALSAGGGQISIKSQNSLTIIGSKITSNVKSGHGKGGDINLIANVNVLNRSKVQANAEEGDGGAIFIRSDHFIKSTNSYVEATSERGNEGTVKIEAPDIDISSGLADLSSDFLDASRWISKACAARTEGNISRLIVHGRDGVPKGPKGHYDLWPSPMLAFDRFNENTEILKVFIEFEKYYHKGDIESAAQSLKISFELLDKNSNYYLSSISHLTQALQSLGYHQKALTLCKKNLLIAEKNKSLADKILFYSVFGDLLLSLDDLSGSVKNLKIALKHAKEFKNPTLLAFVLNNIANALIVDTKIETGIRTYDKALSLLAKSDKPKADAGLKAKILMNLTYILVKVGTYEDTITAYQNAFNHIKTLPNNHTKALNYIFLSQLSRQIVQFFPDKNINFPETSFNLLTRARTIGEKQQDDKILSMSNGYAGQFLEESSKFSQAIQKTRNAIFFAEQKNLKEILYLWQWQLGRLFKSIDEENKAIHSYKDAIWTLSKIRGELFNGIRMHTNVFETNVKPVYIGLTDLYLSQADKENDPAIKERKIILARNVMESLKNAELQDYFEDECVSKNQKNKSDTLDRTPEGVALLYPIALPDRLSILLTLPDCIKKYNVNINYKNLNTIVKQYRKQVQSRISNQFLDNSKELYEYLIRPVEKDIKAANIHTLLVAPDGVLRLIPFSSLYDSKQFLIEKYAIVTVPAIGLTDTSPYGHKNNKILINGLSDAVQDFSGLQSVDKELNDIKRIMNGKNIYLNDNYTVFNITNEFKTNDYSIVHFATHGVFEGTGKNSFLLTYESQLNMNYLEYLMSLGKYRGHQVDLLTLSACQTALGNERAALGLAGVAVKAGVRSAIATLWYVDDEATSLTISEFYRQLKKTNISKAKALQNAQKKLIAQQKYWHPVYWAPFLFIGSWI